MPERGVVEVTGAVDDAWLTAESNQVTRCWGRYKLVLVTNLRDFVLVGADASGRPAKLEPYGWRRMLTTAGGGWTGLAPSPAKSAPASANILPGRSRTGPP